MVDITELKQAIEAVEHRKGYLNPAISKFFVSKDVPNQSSLWVTMELNALYLPIENLICLFGEVVYCDFNEHYMDSLIQKILQSFDVDAEDAKLLNAIKKIPELIASCRLKLNETSMQLQYPWDQTAKNGEENFNALSLNLQQEFFLQLDQAKNIIVQLEGQMKDTIKHMEVKKELNSFVNRTKNIKQHVQNIIDLSKDQEYRNKGYRIKEKFQVLRILVEQLNPDYLIEKLKDFVKQCQSFLTSANVVVENFRKYFEELIIYEPVYQFSNLYEFKIAVSQRKSDINMISFVKSKIWTQKLFNDVFSMVENVLNKLSIRILNLSPAYVDEIVALVKRDPIGEEIIKLLNEYKTLYQPTKLDGVFNFIQFDYVQLIKKHEARITEMKDDELNKLDKLIISVIDRIKTKGQHINVTQLKNLRKAALENSDNIRTVNLFKLRLFYTCKDQTGNSERLKQIKFDLEQSIKDAKKIKSDSETAINKELENVIEAISACFKRIEILPSKLQQFFEAAPGQGKI